VTTLQDVAQKAGVSTATVSKVLSNTPYVSEETRAKVMLAVQELGYRPNLAARALSSGKTLVIGVVFPYIYDAIFTDPLVLQILEGIEAICSQHNHNLLLNTPRLSETGLDENYQTLIRSGYIDGLIAIDNVPLASAVQPAIQRGIPSVAIGYHPTQYYVRGDDYTGGKKLMEHILSLGHREIGIITVPENMNFAVNQRMMGLRSVAESHGLDYCMMPITYSDFSVQGGEESCIDLLKQHSNLTAIISMNDRMAMGAVRQIQKMGRRVPDDVTVVGYDNIDSSEICTPPLTTIDQQATHLGRTAAQMLFEVLKGEKPSPVTLSIELLIRGSSGAPCL
jgi:DNA-binding LacI/PurR family transcriptional regulator